MSRGTGGSGRDKPGRGDCATRDNRPLSRPATGWGHWPCFQWLPRLLPTLLGHTAIGRLIPKGDTNRVLFLAGRRPKNVVRSPIA